MYRKLLFSSRPQQRIIHVGYTISITRCFPYHASSRVKIEYTMIVSCKVDIINVS